MDRNRHEFIAEPSVRDRLADNTQSRQTTLRVSAVEARSLSAGEHTDQMIRGGEPYLSNPDNAVSAEARVLDPAICDAITSDSNFLTGSSGEN